MMTDDTFAEIFCPRNSLNVASKKSSMMDVGLNVRSSSNECKCFRINPRYFCTKANRYLWRVCEQFFLPFAPRRRDGGCKTISLRQKQHNEIYS